MSSPATLRVRLGSSDSGEPTGSAVPFTRYDPTSTPALTTAFACRRACSAITIDHQVGGIACGVISDRLQSRAIIASGAMFASVPLMYIYRSAVYSSSVSNSLNGS